LAEASETVLFEAFGDAGCDVLELSTYDDLLDAIRRFAALRKAQRALGGGGTSLQKRDDMFASVEAAS
jgi:hypothetical protein